MKRRQRPWTYSMTWHPPSNDTLGNAKTLSHVHRPVKFRARQEFSFANFSFPQNRSVAHIEGRTKGLMHEPSPGAR